MANDSNWQMPLRKSLIVSPTVVSNPSGSMVPSALFGPDRPRSQRSAALQRAPVGLPAQGGLSPLQPLAVMFAGVARPMPAILHNLSVKFARTPAVGLVGLRR
jgi:hypothetical protein